MGPLSNSDDSSPVPFSSYMPRVAIVTGSAQGIGYDIALRLADDGIDIAINDIPSKQKQIDSVVEEVRKRGRRALAVPGDVSSEADVISIIEKTVQDLGRVDIMVANAGIAIINSFLGTSTEAFDTIYAINARGVFLCFKHAALQMIKQERGGRLIAASSSAGKQGTQNLSAYSASKFAVRGITQTASIELRRYGITVNAYAPGFIRTALGKPTLITDRANDNSGPHVAITPDGIDDNCVSIKKIFGVPDAPVADADTVASIVSYLVKPEAYFVNGQTISIDGGFRYD